MSIMVRSFKIVEGQSFKTSSTNDVLTCLVPPTPSDGCGILAVTVIVYTPICAGRVAVAVMVLVRASNAMNDGWLIETEFRTKLRV